MEKIQKVAKVVRIICQIAFWLTIISFPFISIAAYYDNPLWFSFINETVNTKDWSVTAKLTLSIYILIIGYVQVYVLYFLYRLFQSFEQGVLFRIKNSDYFRNIGILVIIFWFLELIARIAYQYNISNEIKITLIPDTVFFGFLLIFLSWIWKEVGKSISNPANSEDSNTDDLINMTE